jgi:hypothetical protein
MSATGCHRSLSQLPRAAQQLDGVDPASRVFGFGAILALAGWAPHLDAVGLHREVGVTQDAQLHLHYLRASIRRE